MISSYFSHPLFETLNLAPHQVAVYQAALELGQCSQVELAERAEIKRTTLREYLPELLEKGLLQQVIKGKRTEYIATDPRQLVSELKDKLQVVEEALPALLARRKAGAEKPVMRYFEGLDGLKQVYDLSISVGQPLVSFLRVEKIDPELRRWIIQSYLPRRHAKKIATRNIVNPSSEAAKLTPENSLRENRNLPYEKFPFDMEVFVFADYVAYMHYEEGQELYAVLIQSQIAADTMRSIHAALWELLPVPDQLGDTSEMV